MAAHCGTSEDAKTAREHRPVSVCNAVTTDTWKGRLDFDRACTHPEQRCWLCAELTPWNQVMHELAYELVELRPGKLRLRPVRRGDGHVDRDQATVAAKASFVISWLLQHHRCVDELKVTYGVYPGPEENETTFPIRLRPATGSDPRRTVRALEVKATASSWLSNLGIIRPTCYELEDLDAVGGLETLKLDFHKIRPEFAAELAKLLRRNASSIKSFDISNAKLPRQVSHALRYLFSCESLTVSSYWCRRLPSTLSVVRLLHSSTALKKLRVSPIGSTAHMSAIAKELETNTSLTMLGMHVAEASCSPEPVFTALQVNTTLRDLWVTDCRISEKCGQALALMLQNNTGLRFLFIRNASISESSLHLMALALRKNTTLESVHLSSDEVLPINGIAAVCKVLRTNKTLKKLRFTDFTCPQEFGATLARQLTADNCYSRVELPWTEPDLPGLTAALSSSLADVKELHLPDVRSLSVAGLMQLFCTLAPNKCVRTLRVRIKGEPGEKGTALCEVLKVNRTIDCLDLAIDKDGCKFIKEVLHALAENAGITKLMLSIDEIPTFETAMALSFFLVHNKTTTKFYLSFYAGLSPESMAEISQGMLRNNVIVKLRLLTKTLICDNLSFPLFEAVRRNRGALNRAVDFVVSPSLDRQCAEGFELFNGRPCLLKHLRKVTGKEEPEVLLATAAAERYLRDNYLLITGIVQHSVKCHPAEGTQVDALNKDCWLAIVRHLRVADVLT